MMLMRCAIILESYTILLEQSNLFIAIAKKISHHVFNFFYHLTTRIFT